MPTRRTASNATRRTPLREVGAAFWLLLALGCGRREGVMSPPADPPPPPGATPVTTPAASATAQLTAEPTPHTNEQTFRVPTPTQVVLEVPTRVERRAETLREQMERCLDFTVSKDTVATVTNGQMVRVSARNRCDREFSPTDVWFEVKAHSTAGYGIAGRQTGQFQTTIESQGRAETILVVPCNPERAYRFEASVWSGAGGEKSAGE
ncbi:MAG TPA: hypothetical protein VJA66_08845 [Thermoanaerobaculia bacterium]